MLGYGQQSSAMHPSRINIWLTSLLTATAFFAAACAVFAAEPIAVIPGGLPKKAAAKAWPEWRGGPKRDGLSESVPERLPARPRFAWRRVLSGPGMAGVAVQPPFVIVADKSGDGRDDVWRCLEEASGRERWALSYPAPGDMDYTNSPRATPVIRDGKVYLLGAFGHLHCAELATGKILWRRNLLKDFGGVAPTWGFCASPYLDGDRLIAGTASAEAALVALDRHTGALLWKTPGRPTAHAALIVATFGGKRQVAGFDCDSLGGWDPETGRRLWTVKPEGSGEFNVPTPLQYEDRLLAATENQGTRLHAFDGSGTVVAKAVAASTTFKPDVSTPVVVNGLLFGFAHGGLWCLDPRNGLATLWTEPAPGLGDYASLIGGNGRVLAVGVNGSLMLLRAEGGGCRVISRLKVFDRESPEVWSHPALVGEHLYIRAQDEVVCLVLADGTER